MVHGPAQVKLQEALIPSAFLLHMPDLSPTPRAHANSASLSQAPSLTTASLLGPSFYQHTPSPTLEQPETTPRHSLNGFQRPSSKTQPTVLCPISSPSAPCRPRATNGPAPAAPGPICQQPALASLPGWSQVKCGLRGASHQALTLFQYVCGAHQEWKRSGLGISARVCGHHPNKRAAREGRSQCTPFWCSPRYPVSTCRACVHKYFSE